MAPVFTVDLEDYYHSIDIPERWSKYYVRLEDNTNLLLNILQRHHVKAKFYVLGAVASSYKDLVNKVSSYGHSIGSHGYWHRHNECEMDEGDIMTRSILTECSGYRSPFWDTTPRPFLTGGAYFRVMPYVIVKWAVNRTGIFAIHPHDIDSNHPMYETVPKRRYIGLDSALNKLDRLLSEVRWDDPRE